MFTLDEDSAKKVEWIKAGFSTPGEIDCIITANKEDISKALTALDCYVTYQETIVRSSIKEFLTENIYFEIYRESFNPPLNDLFDHLPE